MTEHILAVDDEPFNLDIIDQYLSEAGYRVTTVGGGREALQALELHRDIDAVVLDRMMPEVNGMEVLAAIKAHPLWRDIPVVMQTAAGQKEQVAEGMRAGAFYYLVKPYEEAMLLAMVKAAAEEAKQRKTLRSELHSFHRGITLLNEMAFRFRTVEEARDVAEFVARCFPDAPALQLGLTELAVNAIEHGNLGVTYAEKSQLLLDDCLAAELARRQQLPEYAEKFAELRLSCNRERVTIDLRDQGKGFDWRAYQELSAERAADPHGRGIAMARMLTFENLYYYGVGNELSCSILLNPRPDLPTA
jgi:CheY-like chemotaxis protein